MTGRGAGYCAGYPYPGFANPYVPGWGRGRGFGRGRGRGFGRGFGWGRGRGRGYYPYPRPNFSPAPDFGRAPYYGAPYKEPTPEDEKAYLEEIVKSMEKELAEAKKRIEELSKEKKK
jgi:hypothetical protein